MAGTTLPPLEFVKPYIEFAWQEYIVFCVILASSLSIGVFYGFFEKKNKTNEEFLMAGRSMGILPVTLSLICTFVSAVGLLGFPVEVYFYGTQYVALMFAFPLMTLLLAYIYVPVYFRLHLTSAFEYFEWRFSKRVRMLCSTFSILYLMTYMPTTVFAPSLALDQVAGINLYVSSAAILLICIVYSSIGGLKAVLWTDLLQGIVMAVSLLAIIIAGIVELGGVGVIIDRNKMTNRIQLFNMDVDPRTRHTLWTGMFGGLAFWLPIFAATQSQIQRYNSVATLRSSKITLVLNMFGLITVVLLTSWIGMTIYAKYQLCDPVAAGIVNSPDQLLPLFVMEVLGKYPGLPGLLVGGLTCGTLSTVSSALNSLAATITQDFVKFYRPNLSDEKLTFAAKISSAVCGLIAFTFIFPIAALNDTIQIIPFTTTLAGSLLSPILGAFTLGMFFPWANELGTILAIGVTVGICVLQSLGNIFAGRVPNKLPNQKLFLTTDGCEVFNGTHAYSPPVNVSFDYMNPWKEREDTLDVQIFSTSYMWLNGIGIVSTILLGLIFSGILNLSTNEKRKLVEERLFARPLLTLWERLFGKEYLNSWVKRENPNQFNQNLSSEKQISVIQDGGRVKRFQKNKF